LKWWKEAYLKSTLGSHEQKFYILVRIGLQLGGVTLCTIITNFTLLHLNSMKIVLKFNYTKFILKGLELD